jgi:hypothetical protein
MADPQDLPPSSRVAQMHTRDAKLFADLGIPAAILVAVGAAGLAAIFAGWPHWGAGLCTVGFGGALVMRLRLVETTPPAKLATPLWRGYLTVVAVITWAFVSWQTWIWLHPSIGSFQVQGFTPGQVKDAVQEARDATFMFFKDQLDQTNKDNEALRLNVKQLTDALAKATAQPQTKSDVPVAVDKLPTSLTLSFTANAVEQIGGAPNVVWTKMFGWGGRQITLFGTPGNPAWVIVLVFKKPIAYKTFCFDGHKSSISTPAAETNPYYAIITFDPGPLEGTVDLRAANECPK